MTTSDNPTDDELLALLRAGQADLDPPPDGLAEAAMRALTWDTGLAELVAAATEAEPVPVRSGDGATGVLEPSVVDLTFDVDGTILEVTIEADAVAGGYQLTGMVHPRCDEVRVLAPASGTAPTVIDCDSFGRFEAEIDASDAAGPLALAFDLPDGRTVRTELFDLP